jgi:hypothetical protein
VLQENEVFPVALAGIADFYHCVGQLGELFDFSQNGFCILNVEDD